MKMKNKWYYKLAVGMVCCGLQFIALQLFLGENPFGIGWSLFIRNTMLIMLFQGVFVLLFHNVKGGILCGGSLILLVGIANYIVCQIRGYGIVFKDLYALSTAATVAGKYKVHWNFFLTLALGISAVGMAAVYFLLPSAEKREQSVKKNLAYLAGSVICVGSLVGCVRSDMFMEGAQDLYWNQQIGIRECGYPMYFAANIGISKVSAPEGYTKELAEQILDRYQSKSTQKTSATTPNVIVIMNESFSDLRVLGKFTTNEPVMPFWDSLSDNAVKGYALSSVYGGYTANSEFEFLTGCTKAFLSGSPYLEYIQQQTPAMPQWLKSMSAVKKVTAMHPYYASGYNRDRIYPLLGFDDFLSLDSYQGADKLGNYISDAADYDKIIEQYEKKKEQETYSVFNVTMQNHSPYTKAWKGDCAVKITSFEAEEAVNRYLSMMRKSDEALKNLFAYFQQVEEPTVIVVFGDHQPHFSQAFYYQVVGKIDSQMSQEEISRKYEVPFLIWANYDIPEKQVEHTSLNYLCAEMADATGMQTSAYQDFLLELQQKVPALSAAGAYDEKESYATKEEITSRYSAELQEYKIVQYYTLFEKDRQEKYYETVS